MNLKDADHVSCYMIKPFCEILKQYSISSMLKFINKHSINNSSLDAALLKYSPYFQTKAHIIFSPPVPHNLISILDHLN